MRKLFFFRSSSSDNVNKKIVPSPPSEDEKSHRDRPWETGDKREGSNKVSKHTGSPKDMVSNSRKQLLEAPTRGLRRSLSFSSASFESNNFGDRNLFSLRNPTTSSTISSSMLHCSSDQQACTSCHSSSPEGQQSEVVDLYIDGEQQQQQQEPDRNLRAQGNSSYQRRPTGNEDGSRWLPPIVQSTKPTSPTGCYIERPRSFSFRETRESRLRFSERNDSEPKSPQNVAKNVVKRLSQAFPRIPKDSSRDFDSDTPTTVEDIFEDYLSRHHVSKPDGVFKSTFPFDNPNKNINRYSEEMSGIQKENHSGYSHKGKYSVYTDVDEDLELQKKAKEAVERVTLLSEELEPENFLRDNDFNLPTLLQIIRNLAESRRSLALEVSDHLECRISERASAKEAIRVAKGELDSQTRRLEKEKVEMQVGLEKELDRRSSVWSLKLEKFQLEEKRLRERVRELAEQNVLLQRKVSSLNSREEESSGRVKHSELQLEDTTEKLEVVSKENQNLQQNLFDLREQFKGAQADYGSIQRNYKEKEKENSDLQKVIARLQKTCSEQEKTISGLRQGLIDEVEKKQSYKNFDSHASKLQIEQVRLTGLEQTLRKEVESCRLEVERLRHENIYLLDRLRCGQNACGSSVFKLDQELQAQVECLQNQGLLLFSESNQLSAKLLELIKLKEGQLFGSATEFECGQDVNKNGMDGYFLVESDMKIQSLKRRFDNLKRSLETVSSILYKKSDSVVLGSQSTIMKDSDSGKPISQTLENEIELQLKAETLVTCLLREKILGKQLEVDQLVAELATAIRGHEILRCESQAALDTLSSMSHKMKDLELQMSRKDEAINQLQSNLQDCSKELNITKGILPKVSEERDLMWEEVKQYSEQNMLLNSEVNSLKNKIEILDEDILVKEGQIAILKDSLEKKSFDILSSPKSLHEFRLD